MAKEVVLFYEERTTTPTSTSPRLPALCGPPLKSARRHWRAGALIALVLAASFFLPLTSASGVGPAATHDSSSITATLRVGSSTTTLYRSFFGVNGETTPVTAYTQVPKLGAYLNSTPIGMIRYSAGEDECNVTTDTMWLAGPTGGIPIPNGCDYDVASFAAWCDSLTPHCESDIGLPGENNNSAEDAYFAAYIVKTLGFQPTYWSIGNEPISWTHYGIPWQKWKLTDNSAPTGVAYAVDVRNAVRAVKAVDPAAQFVGLQSYWCPDVTYTEPIAAIDGDSINAISCHVYTNDGTSTPTTAQYFASLMGPKNITSNYYDLKAHIRDLCAKCSSLPIQIGEFQGGPVGLPAPQDRGYLGAVWMAASFVQALNAGIQSVQVFNLQGAPGCEFCMLNAFDVPDPQGLLFSDVFSNLERGRPVYNVSVRSDNTNLWATMIHGTITNTSQILFVNANVSHAETFGLSTRFFTTGQPGSILSWNDPAASPTTTKYPALPDRVTVPPLSLVLVTVTPNPSSAAAPSASPFLADPAPVVGGHALPLPVVDPAYAEQRALAAAVVARGAEYPVPAPTFSSPRAG